MIVENKLIIFVKAPRPGRVKTRLAESIGADAACAAYIVLVERLIDKLKCIPNVELRFAPDDAAKEIEPWMQTGWQSRPQGPGDLGEKLQRACQESFLAGASRVVVIGSDCPDIEPEDIQEAWSVLKGSEVVIGPATDGGYWLIGLSEPAPALFESIPWSTDLVLEKTLALVEEGELSYHLLRELGDIDVVEDWEKFCVKAEKKTVRRNNSK